VEKLSHGPNIVIGVFAGRAFIIFNNSLDTGASSSKKKRCYATAPTRSGEMLSHKQQRNAAPINQGSMRTCSDCARRNSCVLFTERREWARSVDEDFWCVTHARNQSRPSICIRVPSAVQATDREWIVNETWPKQPDKSQIKAADNYGRNHCNVVWCRALVRSEPCGFCLPRNLSLGAITEISLVDICSYFCFECERYEANLPMFWFWKLYFFISNPWLFFFEHFGNET